LQGELRRRIKHLLQPPLRCNEVQPTAPIKRAHYRPHHDWHGRYRIRISRTFGRSAKRKCTPSRARRPRWRAHALRITSTPSALKSSAGARHLPDRYQIYACAYMVQHTRPTRCRTGGLWSLLDVGVLRVSGAGRMVTSYVDLYQKNRTR
jgi:hypothetical protein